mmetsp:Transcript_33602/g.66901  ORF Transcript_33602/g.66901 Transcript_33602/m.66901 type:complete len:205 (+) Transcript_33602:109-723(+)
MNHFLPTAIHHIHHNANATRSNHAPLSPQPSCLGTSAPTRKDTGRCLHRSWFLSASRPFFFFFFFSVSFYYQTPRWYHSRWSGSGSYLKSKLASLQKQVPRPVLPLQLSQQVNRQRAHTLSPSSPAPSSQSSAGGSFFFFSLPPGLRPQPSHLAPPEPSQLGPGQSSGSASQTSKCTRSKSALLLPPPPLLAVRLLGRPLLLLL